MSMTAQQTALYRAAVTIGKRFGRNGGASSWTGFRSHDNTPASDGTIESLSARTIYFVENNLVSLKHAIPTVPIFAASYWGIASIDVDILVGDLYVNDTTAVLVTGLPDVSQGFQLIPADLTQVPA